MKRRRGFTLIELLVVIAIIALLMSILMPALHHAKKQAEMVICQTRLQHWGLVFKLYTDDWDGYFNHGRKDTNFPGEFWFVVLRPYYKDSWDLLLCPTATVESEGTNDYGTFKAEGTDQGGRHYVISYGLNTWSNYLTSPYAGVSQRPAAWHWKGVHNIKNASTIPLLGDSTHFDGWPHADTIFVDTPPQYPDDFGSGNTSSWQHEIRHWCINRHNGFLNMLFMDWGVRRVGLKELWTLKWHREFDTKNAWTIAYYSGPEVTEDPVTLCKEHWSNPANGAPWMARFRPY